MRWDENVQGERVCWGVGTGPVPGAEEARAAGFRVDPVSKHLEAGLAEKEQPPLLAGFIAGPRVASPPH